MKCPKCQGGQGDLYIPIDKGELTEDAYFFCDNCGYDEKLSNRDLMALFYNQMKVVR